MTQIEKLLTRQSSWKKTNVKFTPTSKLTRAALKFATEAHKGQTRHSGEPYVTHAIAVAYLLQTVWGIDDDELLAAALLHDTLEDVPWVTKEILQKQFGKEVSMLVEGVSKFKSHNGEENHTKTLHKIIEKSYINPRVAVLKLADRLHNLLTLQALPTHKQPRKAHETLDIYTRLAESLGMWIVKRDLEDLAFMYAEPELYKKTKKEVDTDPRLRPEFIESWLKQIRRIISLEDHEGNVEIRINGYWSLTKKRERAARLSKSLPDSFVDINDVVSFRVLMDSVHDCYCFIGELHKELGNIVDFSRYDEFIGANSRDNGYQALQTTLLTPSGAIEIAVTTRELETFNNWGVVALLKKGTEKLEQYALKLVFTPTNEVRFLPREATGIDFAYAINPRLGADARAVMINKKRHPLSDIIPNAATVEVLTGKTRRAPGEDALYYCLPATARIIQEQLKQARRDTLVINGRKKLEHILSPLGILEPEDLGNQLTRLLYWFGCQSVGDLCFKVGGGYLLPQTIHNWFYEEGLTKESLAVTTIMLKGKDRRGILDDLATWINKSKGNIIRMNSQSKKGTFQLKVVVEGLNEKEKTKIAKKLSRDTRFTAWKLV